MTTWLLYSLLGLGAGAVYAALAMGTILAFRGSSVVNFAQGSMATLPAFVYLELRDTGELVLPTVGIPNRFDLGGPMGFWPAFLIGVALAALVGFLADLVIFHPLRNATPVAKVIATVGLNAVLIGLLVHNFDNEVRTGPDILPSDTIRMFGRNVPQDRFWLAGLAVLTAVGLWALMKFTAFGLATRAAATNEKGVVLLGWSPRLLGSLNWVIASTLAGAAGILITPIRGVSPFSYSGYLIAALAAALAARLTSFGIAAAVGIGIGMFQGLAVHLVSTRQVPGFLEGGFQTVVPFIIIVVALATFGTTLPTRGSMEEEKYPEAPKPRVRPGTAAVAIGVAVAVLSFGSSTLRLATIESLTQAVLVMSIVVLAGFVGQVTLAELTFAGFSAFMLSRFADRMGIPFPLSPLLAIAATTMVGTLASFPAVRIRGIQFAIVTIAAATTIEEVLFGNPSFTGPGGVASVPTPRIAGFDLGIIQVGDYPNKAFGYFALLCAIGCAILLVNVRRTSTGLRMLAVRANERAAAASGINVPNTKLLGASIGSFIAGVAGVLLAYKFVDFSNAGFEAIRGLQVVALAYLGGIATVSGAFVAGFLAPAGVLFTLLGSDASESQLLISGIGLIVVAIKFPGGIAGSFERVRHWLRRTVNRAGTQPTTTSAGDEVIEWEMVRD